MKKIFLIAILIFPSFLVIGQELGLQFGKSISKFKFVDSDGVELDNLQRSDNFFMTLDYRQQIMLETFNGKMYMDMGLGYNRYGASGSDAVLNNSYSWDVTYLGINLGLDYLVYRNRSVMFFAKMSVAPEFLLHGSQTLNNQVYDLRGEEDFESPMYFFRGGAGMQFEISDEASAFVQYMGGKSYTFNGSSEKLNIIAHNVGFGMIFKLIKDPYQTEWRGNRKKIKEPKD